MKFRALYLNPVDTRDHCKFWRNFNNQKCEKAFIDPQHVSFGKTNTVFSSQVL